MRGRDDVSEKKDSTFFSLTAIGWTLIASVLASLVGGVMFAGWRIAGNGADWFPSLLIVAIAITCIRVIGNVDGRWRAVATVATTGLAIAIGHALIAIRGYEAFIESSVTPSIAYSVAILVAGLSERILDRANGFVAVPEPREGQPSASIRQTIRPHRWLAIGLLAWVIFVALAYQRAATLDRTGFRIMTAPLDQQSAAMPLAGFSIWHQNQPVMMETIPAIEQVQWFCGQIRSDDNFRFLRSGYAFAATFFVGLLSPASALRCVNVIAWLCTLLIVGWLSLSWPRDEDSGDARVNIYAAFCSVTIATVGVGFGIHINDTTPHLMSFCLYAIGIAMIVRMGFADQTQPWSRHLSFAIAVGFFSWTYNVAQMLLFVYATVSVFRQRWLSIATTIVIVVLHRPIWRWSLPALGINVREVEGEYFARAIAAWRESFVQGPMQFISDGALYAYQSVTAMETPWVLLIGLVAAPLVVPRKQRLLWASAFAAPILSSIVFGPTSQSRGYIVFGASVVLYLIVGRLLGRLMAGVGTKRVVAVAGLVCIVAANFVWTTAHHHGWYGPAKMYLMGLPDASAVVLAPPPIIVDAAGSHPVPTSLGSTSLGSTSLGSTSLGGEAATFDSKSRFNEDEPIVAKLFSLAVLSRLPFVISIVLMIGLSAVPLVWKRGLMAGTLLLSLAMTLVGFASVTRQQRYVDNGRAIVLEPRQSLTYQIMLDDASRKRFGDVADEMNAPDVMLWFGNDGGVDVTWSADSETVELKNHLGEPRKMVSSADLRRVLSASTWTFTFVNSGDQATFLHGWQSSRSVGRLIDTEGSVLPAIELRIRHPETGVLAAAMY